MFKARLVLDFVSLENQRIDYTLRCTLFVCERLFRSSFGLSQPFFQFSDIIHRAFGLVLWKHIGSSSLLLAKAVVVENGR